MSTQAPVPSTFEDLLRTKSSIDRRKKFASLLKALQPDVGFRISGRGWCYILEQKGVVTKDNFSKVRTWINACRRHGDLPIDFTADESGREFFGVVPWHEHTPVQHLKTEWFDKYPHLTETYCGDWLEGEDYYIQMIVEKIDLAHLFLPLTKIYNIPVSSSKGWSSMLQRASYAKRFAEAEDRGKQCVLLYCGDHDPDGLKMSDFFKKNLADVSKVRWRDGTAGYDPENLIVERFGLNWDFVQEHKISIINNLITTTGKDLGSARHVNHKHPYIQEYIKKYGKRKAEAVALITRPKEALELCEESILQFLGDDAAARFRAKRLSIVNYVNRWATTSGFQKLLGGMEECMRVEDELMEDSTWL